jgi:hypothetical protein
MTLVDQMIDFFNSAFYFPGLSGALVLLSIALGMVFGAVWLAGYRPPIYRKPWLWAIAVISAFLTWIAIALFRFLFNIDRESSGLFLGPEDAYQLAASGGHSADLLSGLVKRVQTRPGGLYWWHMEKPDACMGLVVGAVSGAGFGIFEVVWVHNSIFASGWGWNLVETSGYLALLGFWERFFSVGFHVAVSALAGYGLAKGLGWQFYLIASFLHGLTNYSALLVQNRTLTVTQVEVYIAVLAVAITAVALWLLRRRSGLQPSANAPDNEG